ncbi:MAG: DNA-3-methyladenine glycosylase I, partial [Cyanobacteria bacterium J06648_11]
MTIAAPPESIDDRPRCPWVDLSKPDYVAYHDCEWGVPVFDDRLTFESLTLESAQAGLSWYTILRKREAYRLAFDNFDPEKVARYDAQKQRSLLQNPGIVRNRLKIAASISNARLFLDVRAEFGSFVEYIWQFVDRSPIVNTLHAQADYPATSPESDALSQDLKQRGFKFVGSTICYAHMQATGLVNDHALTCFRRQDIIDRYPKQFPAIAL